MPLKMEKGGTIAAFSNTQEFATSVSQCLLRGDKSSIACGQLRLSEKTTSHDRRRCRTFFKRPC